MDREALLAEHRELLAAIAGQRNSIVFYEGESRRFQGHADQHKAAAAKLELRLAEIDAELRTAP